MSEKFHQDNPQEQVPQTVEEQVEVQAPQKVETKTDWKEKKEDIVKAMNNRVETAVDIKRTVEGITLDQSHEEVKAIMLECLDRQERKFPPKTIQDKEKYKKAQEDLEQAKRELDKLEESIAGEGDDAEYDKNHKAYMKIYSTIDFLSQQKEELSSNIDVQFLLHTEKIINKLIDKNKYIKETLEIGGEEKFKKDFLALEPERGKNLLEGGEVKKITVEPFDVIMDINPLEKDGIFGRYFTGTPFIGVYKRKDAVFSRESTVRHERIHNVLDHVEITRAYNSGIHRFDHLYKSYQDMVAKKAPDVIIKCRKDLLGRIKYYDMINENHEEIVAATERAETLGFRNELFGLKINNDEKKKPSFSEVARSLATAGFEMAIADDKLGAYSKGEKNAEVRKTISDLRRNFRNGVVNMSEQMRRSLAIANAMDSETREKVYMLLMMLPPSKYGHIKTYLESLDNYDEKAVKINIKNQKLLKDFSFSPKEVEQLVTRVEKGKLVLDQVDKDILAHAFKSPTFYEHLRPRKIYDIEDIEKYVEFSKRAAKIVGVEFPEEEMEHNIYYHHFHSILEKAIKTQFKGIAKTYEGLSEDQKNRFVAVLSEYVSEGVFDEDLEDAGVKISSMEELRKYPLYKELQKIGLEGILENTKEVIEK